MTRTLSQVWLLVRHSWEARLGPYSTDSIPVAVRGLSGSEEEGRAFPPLAHAEPAENTVVRCSRYFRVGLFLLTKC